MPAHEAFDQGMTILDLPVTWLVDLIQHVAAGPGGLSSAASLSQSCKRFHTLSDSSAVTYCNLHVDQAISSPDHPVCEWLAKRQGRITGLHGLTVDFGDTFRDTSTIDHPGWEQPLGALTSVHDAHLTVRLRVHTPWPSEHPFVAQWLRQHGGDLVDHLVASVSNTDGAEVQEFCRAVAPCRSVDLDLSHRTESFDLGALAPIAGTLVQLSSFTPGRAVYGKLTGFSTFTSFSQLTSLFVCCNGFTEEDAWAHFAGLRSLQDLCLVVGASGDPSPLSALNSLSSLHLRSLKTAEGGEGFNPFTFSSLQPLSTLQHLEVLKLQGYSCSATSLQGLDGLGRLRELTLEHADQLVSLDGLSSSVTSLDVVGLLKLPNLAGMEGLQRLQRLSVGSCGITSFQALSGLSTLTRLRVYDCPLTSLEFLRGTLSTCLQSLHVWRCKHLQRMSGLEAVKALQELLIYSCGLTSLQPLAHVTTGLEKLHVTRCSQVQDEVLELPHMEPTSDVRISFSNVREVVLAGGIRRECRILLHLSPVKVFWILSCVTGLGLMKGYEGALIELPAGLCCLS